MLPPRPTKARREAIGIVVLTVMGILKPADSGHPIA
jgi:hypothetical protein